MVFWRISMLGTELAAAVRQPPPHLPDATWAMIGCLMSAPRRTLSRGQLAAELWPDSCDDDARNCLSSALWRIRKSLPCFDRLIETSSDHFRLNPSANIWIDVVAFEQRVSLALAQPDRLSSIVERCRLERGLMLYRGEFLRRRECESIQIERERLRALYLDAGYLLAESCARNGEWQTTRKLCTALCVAEPLREDLQRLLIEAYLETGNRALALRQYNQLCDCLSRELQVEPMPQSQALARRIAGPLSEPTNAACRGEPTDMRAILMTARRQVASTLSLIDSALSY